ncbi:hypothetical protein [Paenibacillus polymyxa]|uniref:hypothetical protein n=1 Tax=Paenibacillus polymyxa TaxID=1406 RepID=UPI00296F0EA9|nr:hypothetical protein [Paenibacillus polymyxa]WOZ40383.1 hypothetical protein RQP19_10200 [Paenibacillus polymyxa]
MEFVNTKIAHVILKDAEINANGTSSRYIYFDQETVESLGGFPKRGEQVVLIDGEDNESETKYVEAHGDYDCRINNPKFIKKHFSRLYENRNILIARVDGEHYTLKLYLA